MLGNKQAVSTAPLWALHTLLLSAVATPVWSGNFGLGPIEGEWQLQGSYVYSVRTEKPHPGVVATGGRKQVETPEYLKWPESNNFDDGDRNFKQWEAVNNRATMLGEVQFKWGYDFGALIRGDAFYDLVYRSDHNSNDNEESISTTQDPFNSFTEDNRFFSGKRARLLDAYAYGSWYLPGNMVLNLRVGEHIAAWGESLFFSGVALAQAPADATKATVPGADVKSILLPVNQVSFQLAATDKLTILGQYKLEFKEIELNPVGEFFSPADVVGPGAEFIYGIRNPLHADNLSQFNFSNNDSIETLNLIGQLSFGTDPGVPPIIPEGLPATQLPTSGAAFPGAGRGIDVYREDDIRPSDSGQWGFGLRYALNSITTVGAYHLRYHATTPAPVQNYGYGVLAESQAPGQPDITTEYFDLLVPVTYNIRYFDGVHLSAFSASTVLFGTNFGMELIYRDGADVLVDVHAAILGDVPTPTRATTWQALISWLYVLGPGPFWDSIVWVGETAFIHIDKIQPQPNTDGEMFDTLTFDRDTAGVQFLAYIDNRNVLSGWDMRVPVSVAGVITGHSALAGGLGSLMGESDYRFGIGVEMTRLNKLTLGMLYNSYLGGTAHFSERPYQDRDTLALTVKYSF